MISFLSVFPPYRGGIATFSDALFKHLSNKTTITAYNFKKQYPELLFPGKSQKIDAEDESYAEEIFHPYDIISQRSAAERIFSDSSRFLLYSYWHPFFAPAYRRLLIAGKKRYPDVKTVAVAHNVIPHERFPFKKALVRSLFNHTDCVVLLSEQTRTQYESLAVNTPAEKLFHPVYELPEPKESKHELREKYGFTESDKIVLFFGLVREYKGVDLLIDALNEVDLEATSIRPLIVGEFYTDKGPIVSKIKPEYKEYYTVLDQFVSEEEMSEIFALADLLVLPYRRGSQSGVLANAVDSNLPALVSDLPGLSEHITHLENGLIFETGNVNDLRNNILNYFENDLKTQFSEPLDELKKQLSWGRFAQTLLQLIERL